MAKFVSLQALTLKTNPASLSISPEYKNVAICCSCCSWASTPTQTCSPSQLLGKGHPSVIQCCRHRNNINSNSEERGLLSTQRPAIKTDLEMSSDRKLQTHQRPRASAKPNQLNSCALCTDFFCSSYCANQLF